MRWGCCICGCDVSFRSRERCEALLAKCDSVELLATVLCALLFCFSAFLLVCGVEMLQCSKRGERRRRRDPELLLPTFPLGHGG